VIPLTLRLLPPLFGTGRPAFLQMPGQNDFMTFTREAWLPFDNPKRPAKELSHMTLRKSLCSRRRREKTVRIAYPLALLLLLPIAAHAQSPFDTGLTAMQTLFTGTVARATSLIAIVLGGYAFAHGEPGHKKTLAGVAAGTGVAVLATNVLTWLWGV
jgi:type IV secretory pathway VirB2 component (pilin)